MPLKRRPLDRSQGAVRDAKIVVIASEDKYAVKQYFERFKSSRVQFLTLATEDCNSAPQHVMDRLKEHAAEYQFGNGDELWLCIDTDRWTEPNHLPNLVRIFQECKQKGYRTAVSNPCIELWLLLHYQEYPPDGEKVKCSEVVELLGKAAGGYNKKSGPKDRIQREMVEQAVRRAKGMEGVEEEIPGKPCTQVYRIFEELLDIGLIEWA